MTDIVERLHDHNDPRSFETRLEAADVIERLRAALKDIADLRYDYDCAPIDIARRALEPKP